MWRHDSRAISLGRRIALGIGTGLRITLGPTRLTRPLKGRITLGLRRACLRFTQPQLFKRAFATTQLPVHDAGGRIQLRTTNTGSRQSARAPVHQPRSW
jgi:hypothetical protein